MLIEYLVIRGVIEAVIHCPSLLDKPIKIVSDVVETTTAVVTAPVRAIQNVADRISDIKKSL